MKRSIAIFLFIILLPFILIGLTPSPHGGFRFLFWWPFRLTETKHYGRTFQPLNEEQMNERIKQRDELGWPGIVRSAALGNLSGVKEDIARGDSVNATDGAGRTALDWAFLGGRTEVIEYLQQHGGQRGDDLKKIKTKRIK